VSESTYDEQRSPVIDTGSPVAAGAAEAAGAPDAFRTVREMSTGGAQSGVATGDGLLTASGALVSNSELFRTRWSSVQVGFVDDPARAVEEAEQLVTDVIADLVEGFRWHRQQLEDDRDGSTDEMRVAFQRYRDFFDRLLNV
jgi:hypothetical protein